jgi:hypothetical protein
MTIEKLKQKLANILPYEKVEGWEGFTQKEQDYCYELNSGFESIKNRLLGTIEAIEKVSKTIYYDNDSHLEREEIQSVKASFIANLKKAIGIVARIIKTEQKLK